MIYQETGNKIPFDLEPLRSNQLGKFTLRFLDINEQQKNLLALRIKQTARQWNIRNEINEKSTVDKIYQALKEINPIIFSENTNPYISAGSYRNFGSFDTQTLSGWYYKRLCEAIYQMICIKRPLKRDELDRIAQLTCRDTPFAHRFVDERYIPTGRESNQSQSTSIPEIGLNEMEDIRRRAENNGADNIPMSMYDSNEAENELTISEDMNNRAFITAMGNNRYNDYSGIQSSPIINGNIDTSVNQMTDEELLELDEATN